MRRTYCRTKPSGTVCTKDEGTSNARSFIVGETRTIKRTSGSDSDSFVSTNVSTVGRSEKDAGRRRVSRTSIVFILPFSTARGHLGDVHDSESTPWKAIERGVSIFATSTWKRDDDAAASVVSKSPLIFSWTPSRETAFVTFAHCRYRRSFCCV